jgi:hypothetical protein
MACLRLVTFFPLRPDLSVPFFISFISLSTFLPADGEYFRVEDFFAGFFLLLVFFALVDFFLAAFLVAIFYSSSGIRWLLHQGQLLVRQSPLRVGRTALRADDTRGTDRL